MPPGDLERIEIDVDVRDEVFYITPFKVKYAHKPRMRELDRIERPLMFTNEYVSSFWTKQLVAVNKKQPGIVGWALHEISRIVDAHRSKRQAGNVLEPDLLRASGPLKHLGVALGPYVGRGYDCLTTFQFLSLPEYSIPVEVKKRSSGFRYQQNKYGKDELSRAIVLCAFHEHRTMPPHIDVIELDALSQYTHKFPVSS